MAPKKTGTAFAVALSTAFPESPATATPKAAPQPQALGSPAGAAGGTPAKAARGGRPKKATAEPDAAGGAAERAACATPPPRKRGGGAGKAVAEEAQGAPEAATEPPLKRGKSSSGALKLPVPRSPTPRAQQPPEGSRVLRLLSINVAGLRPVLAGDKAAVLKATVEREAPDVLCLSEHKLKGEDVGAAEERLRELLPEYTAARWAVSTAKKGYSGVAVLLRGPAAGAGQAAPIADPAAVAAAATEGMGEGLDKDTIISQEGRLLTLELPELLIVAAYVPNSGMDLKRLAYRTDRGLESCWDRSLGEYVCRLREARGKPVVVMGDMNCAHRVQDIWNMHERPDFPEGLSAKPVDAQYTGLTALKKQSGLTPEERLSLSSLLERAGLVDTFRAVHPEASGVFSFFSQRTVQNRPLNRGLRLDYALASDALCAHLRDGAPPAAALPRVHDSFILDECEQVADHSAVGCWVLLPPAAPAAEAAGGPQASA